MEWGGRRFSSTGGLLHKNWKDGRRRPPGETTIDKGPPHRGIMVLQFDQYMKVLEMLPLDFLEDGVTWVALKLSIACGALEYESIY